MAAFKKSEVALVVAVAVLACMAMAEAAISCGKVAASLGPCVTYLKGGPGPTQACCNGVKSLYQATKGNRADRLTACGCIKTTGSAFNLQPQPVSQITSRCGVNLGYTPSLNINCNAIP